MLAVVQHEQPGRRLQSPVERSLGAPAREDLDPQGGGDHGAHACLGRDAGQVGPPRDLLGGGDGSRKGGLADSAGADDGDALVACGEGADLVDVVVPADEPRRRLEVWDGECRPRGRLTGRGRRPAVAWSGVRGALEDGALGRVQLRRRVQPQLVREGLPMGCVDGQGLG